MGMTYDELSTYGKLRKVKLILFLNLFKVKQYILKNN